MIAVPKPENEEDRLEELKAYSFLDAFPEKELDELTHLASEICQAPIALIGLIDEQKQWYKSKVGVQHNEVPRELSFCSYALLDPTNVMVVEDARKDIRFRENPFVTQEQGVVSYTGVPLTTSNGYALGTLCVIDIIPKKLLPNQLRALQTLANQAMKIFELRKAEKQLREMNEELQAFTYTVSHDLRAPLRGISAFADILQTDFSEQLGEEGKRISSRLINEAKSMKQLIDNLLEFSHLIHVTPDIQTVNMQEMVNEVYKGLAQFEDKLKPRFIVGQLPPAKADSELVRQVWQNLISNAIKYSSKNSQPLIEIGCEGLGSKPVYFIRDNGAGFDMQFAHKLFGVFERLHTQSEFEGTGVGLAIVKRIIQRHGGRIWAEATVGKGATFYFTI
jgi:signal transduction histidine kinase